MAQGDHTLMKIGVNGGLRSTRPLCSIALGGPCAQLPSLLVKPRSGSHAAERP